MSRSSRTPSLAPRLPHAILRSRAAAAIATALAAGGLASSAAAAGAPIVSVPAAPAYSSTGVYKLSANVNANGSTTAANIQYGATTSYGKTFTYENIPATETRTFTRLTQAMPVGSVVHYRVAAVNASGTTYGPDQTYTVVDKPTVSIAAAPEYVAGGGYKLTVKVTANGAATAANIQYGGSSSYGSTFAYENIPAGETRTFTRTTPAYPAGTEMHYRVRAINSAGLTTGADQTFVVGGKPVVTTAGRPTAQAATSSLLFRLAGTVKGNNLPTTTKLQYGPTTSYGSTITTAGVSAAETKEVLGIINNSGGSTVNYRFVATNAAGVTYGPNQTYKIPGDVVRPIYMVPSDRQYRQDYNDLIVGAFRTVQEFYAAQTGKTFTVAHKPVLCQMPQNGEYYSTFSTDSNGNTIGTWQKLEAALNACLGSTFSQTADYGVYPDIPGATCGGAYRIGAGRERLTFLGHTDLRGLAGETGFTNEPCGTGTDWRTGPWGYTGGLAHELGHTFGLPHPDLSACATPWPADCQYAYESLMYIGYGDIRKTYLLDADKTKLNTSPFFS